MNLTNGTIIFYFDITIIVKVNLYNYDVVEKQFSQELKLSIDKGKHNPKFEILSRIFEGEW